MLSFHFEDSQSKQFAKRLFKFFLGVSALVGAMALGSTFASNINLNGGGNVEFGQGVATTAACDNDITLVPVSTFSNVEENTTFAMTRILISDIDLTPEGWDATSGLQGSWNPHFDLETHSWDDGFEEYVGQYKNISGQWTNTCENKYLLLRAFTDRYPDRTVSENVTSPLYLTGYLNNRPSYGLGTNAGVGFKITQDGSADPSNYGQGLIVDCSYNCSRSPIALENFGATESIGNYSLEINLDANSNFPPLDSRWLDKLTIESTSTLPSGWTG